MHFLFKMDIKVILEINSKNLKLYKILLMFFWSYQSDKQKYLLKSQRKGTVSIALVHYRFVKQQIKYSNHKILIRDSILLIVCFFYKRFKCYKRLEILAWIHM